LCEMALCFLEGGADVANRDGHEFHLSIYIYIYLFEGGDEWGVLGGLLLEPLVASEVLAESDIDDDEATPLAVEDDRVRQRGVRYSSGVDEVGGGAVSLPEKGLLDLVGKYPIQDVSRGLCAFRVS